MAQNPSTWAGSRALLRRLRDLMAGPGRAEQRLGQIAKLIAANMVAEVCSVYVRRAGDLLELFATEGLRQDAVHRTRLRFGEGLVGDIAAHARPLALAEAQNHPMFAFRPETGEEIYTSFMGVPVVRDGRVLGVVAIQNKAPRTYTDEELETLETVAMLLAEMLVGGELVSADELQSDINPEVAPRRLEGATASGGLAMGSAILHRPNIIISNVLADDPAAEQHRVETALTAVEASLDELLAQPDLTDTGAPRDILELFRLFAQDRGWRKRIDEAVQTGLSAEAAVQMVQDDTRARMALASDRYLRERLLDFEDLTNRVLSALVGKAGTRPTPLPDDAVLVARNIGPSELLSYDRKRLRGVVLEEGSATAHAAIVARALDIPMIYQVDEVLSRIRVGDQIIVDADAAHVFLRPGDDILESFANAIAARDERIRSYTALVDRPTVTKDGHEIELMINAGLPADIERIGPVGASGVGLFRTEISFMA
ncbi:MAG: PEP-utilizing enzyme, partial [Alphaproteobacteria bacterium]|nr:PEP-utilizing enzyme [Alphaproteobacteria bacterium]